MEVKKYVDLITSEYYDKPLFKDITYRLLNLSNNATSIIEQISSLFDIETAVGEQLDVIGQYLNLSRNLGLSDGTVPSTLDDDTYRMVLKSRVLQYRWNGTIQGLYDIVQTLFPQSVVLLSDGNMEYTFGILLGSLPDNFGELMIHGYITPKPMGVKVNYIIIEDPFFTFDTNTTYNQGWDLGVWVR